jgi:undecaprenyl-diphosphatase
LTPRLRAGLGAGAVLAAVAAAALSIAVSGEPAPPWERDVVEAATRVPDLLGVPARLVMQFGTFGATVGLALAVAWVTRARLGPVAVLAAGLVALGIANRLKRVVDRGRPTGVRVRELQDSSGYPSSHAAVAFGLAVVLVALVPPRWRWAPIAAATVVALARLHVGVHYPADVTGGALIGTAVGLAVVAAVDPARPGADPVDAGTGPSTPTEDRRRTETDAPGTDAERGPTRSRRPGIDADGT